MGPPPGPRRSPGVLATTCRCTAPAFHGGIRPETRLQGLLCGREAHPGPDREGVVQCKSPFKHVSCQTRGMSTSSAVCRVQQSWLLLIRRCCLSEQQPSSSDPIVAYYWKGEAQVPGPTLILRPGDDVVIRITDALPPGYRVRR